MKSGLDRKTVIGELYEKKFIDVWDVQTKKIVFRGDHHEVANFIGMSAGSVGRYLSTKSVRSKKYTLRVSKNQI